MVPTGLGGTRVPIQGKPGVVAISCQLCAWLRLHAEIGSKAGGWGLVLSTHAHGRSREQYKALLPTRPRKMLLPVVASSLTPC